MTTDYKYSWKLIIWQRKLNFIVCSFLNWLFNETCLFWHNELYLYVWYIGKQQLMSIPPYHIHNIIFVPSLKNEWKLYYLLKDVNGQLYPKRRGPGKIDFGIFAFSADDVNVQSDRWNVRFALVKLNRNYFTINSRNKKKPLMIDIWWRYRITYMQTNWTCKNLFLFLRSFKNMNESAFKAIEVIFSRQRQLQLESKGTVTPDNVISYIIYLILK